MKTTLYDKHYIDCALTDAKNKHYEVEFAHPDERLKIRVKFSYHSKDGKDYFVYNEYINNKQGFCNIAPSREEVIGYIMNCINTPLEKMYKI